MSTTLFLSLNLIKAILQRLFQKAAIIFLTTTFCITYPISMQERILANLSFNKNTIIIYEQDFEKQEKSGS